MSLLSLIDSTVVGIATLVVLILIAALLAWLVAFLYARQIRFHDDLLTTLHKAGIGSDITHAKRAQAGAPTAQLHPSPSLTTGAHQPHRPSALAQARTQLARTIDRVRSPFLHGVRIVGLLVLIGGIGYASTTYYQLHRTGINRQLGRLIDSAQAMGSTAIDRGKQLVANLQSTAPSATADTYSPPTTTPRSSATQTAAATRSTTSTSGPTTDTSLGIAVSVPAGWQIDPASATGQLRLTPKSTATTSESIAVTITRELNSTETNLNQWIAQSYSTDARAKAQSTTVGAWPAVQLSTNKSGVFTDYTVFDTASSDPASVSQIYTATLIAPATLSPTNPTLLAARQIVADITAVLATP